MNLSVCIEIESLDNVICRTFNFYSTTATVQQYNSFHFLLTDECKYGVVLCAVEMDAVAVILYVMYECMQFHCREACLYCRQEQ